MPPTRKINAKEILKDIRSGISDEDLMAKFKLRKTGLAVVFNKLVEAGVITDAEIQQRSPTRGVKEFMPAEFRHLPRTDLDFPLPIHDRSDPEVVGVVNDMSDNGVGIRGISAEVGEVKQFIIPADELFQIAPVEFNALCRWMSKDPADGTYLGGFEIVDLLSGSIGDLQVLIHNLTLEDRATMRSRLV